MLNPALNPELFALIPALNPVLFVLNPALNPAPNPALFVLNPELFPALNPAPNPVLFELNPAPLIVPAVLLPIKLLFAAIKPWFGAIKPLAVEDEEAGALLGRRGIGERSAAAFLARKIAPLLSASIFL